MICDKCQQCFPSEKAHIESLYLLETAKNKTTAMLRCESSSNCKQIFSTPCLLGNHSLLHLPRDKCWEVIHSLKANNEISFELSTKELNEMKQEVRLWYEKNIFNVNLYDNVADSASTSENVRLITKNLVPNSQGSTQSQLTSISGFTLPPSLKVKVTPAIPNTATIVPSTPSKPDLSPTTKTNRTLTITEFLNQVLPSFSEGQTQSITAIHTAETLKLPPNTRIEIKAAPLDQKSASNLLQNSFSNEGNKNVAHEASKLGELFCETCNRNFLTEECHIAYLKTLHDRLGSSQRDAFSCSRCLQTFDLSCFLQQHLLRCQVIDWNAVSQKRSKENKTVLMVENPMLLNKISTKLLEFYYEYIWKRVLNCEQSDTEVPVAKLASSRKITASKTGHPKVETNTESSVTDIHSLDEYTLQTPEDRKIAHEAIKPGRLHCEFCDRYFLTEEIHIAHLKLICQSVENKADIKCGTCQLSFNHNCCAAHHMLQVHSNNPTAIYKRRYDDSKITFQISNPILLTKISPSVLQFYYTKIWKQVLDEKNLELDTTDQKVGYYSSTKGLTTIKEEEFNENHGEYEEELINEPWEEVFDQDEDLAEDSSMIVARTIRMKNIYCKNCSLDFPSEAAHIQYLKEKEDGIQSRSIPTENINCLVCSLVFSQRCLYVHHLLLIHVKDKEKAIELRYKRNIVTYQLSEDELHALTLDALVFYNQMTNGSLPALNINDDDFFLPEPDICDVSLINKQSWPCTQCDKVCKSKGALSSHIQNIHLANDKSQKTIENYIN